MNFNTLNFLIKKIKYNKNKNPGISYTASLFQKGENFCIKKFMEEARPSASMAYNTHSENS